MVALPALHCQTMTQTLHVLLNMHPAKNIAQHFCHDRCAAGDNKPEYFVVQSGSFTLEQCQAGM